MPNKVLSLHDINETNESGWFTRERYNSEIERMSDPSGATTKRLLTAIPSPFARIHLFDAAFKVVSPQSLQKGKTVYHKLVSDCLDVIELLFNINSHNAADFQVSIEVWDRNTHIREFYNPAIPEHRIVGDSLQLFLDQDAQSAHFDQMNRIYLLSYRGEIFAGSSPLSLFFTRPGALNFDIINPATRKHYFTDITPLFERSKDFQLYLHSLFKAFPPLTKNARNFFTYLNQSINLNDIKVRTEILANNATTISPDQFEALYDTVNDESHNKIIIAEALIGSRKYNVEDTVSVSKLKLKSPKKPSDMNGIVPLVAKRSCDSDGKLSTNVIWPTKSTIRYIDRMLPDKNQKYPYIVQDDFLEDHLIKMEYPLNKNYFVLGNIKSGLRDTDPGYLMPIKKEYFDFFNIADLRENLEINKKTTGGIEVKLKVPLEGGDFAVFEKTYYDNPQVDNAGKIVAAKFYMLFFPFYKIISDDLSTETQANGPNYNDYYKIMLIDEEIPLVNKEFALKFFDNYNTEISEKPSSPLKVEKKTRVSKSLQSIEAGTTYYELNTIFDYIELSSPLSTSQSAVKGLIIPDWSKRTLGFKTYDVAVDFGTTNTHVALRDTSSANLAPQSLKISADDLQVVQFNAPVFDERRDISERYEDFSGDMKVVLGQRQMHEFIPSIIGDGQFPKHNFPLRTATSEALNLNPAGMTALSNINISFAYGNDRKRADEQIRTDLKWAINEIGNESRIKQFLRQMLLMIRTKLLMNNGNPSLCRIVWFRPLSMFEASQNLYKEIWDSLYYEIFKVQGKFTVPLTESNAPYYYFNSISEAYGKETILSIDIGGGSTDVSFFSSGKPEFGTSFNFAGNSLWGNGLKAQSKNEMLIFYGKNFIQRKIQELQSSGMKKELEQAFQTFNIDNKGTGLRSEDLFNFYFGHDNVLKITDELKRDGKAKYLALMHYSAIIYHCIELVKLSNLQKPRFICFSGRGSRYLNIIDSTREKSVLTQFTNSFIEDLMGTEKAYKVQLITSENEKEATCNGGLYMIQNSNNKDTTESKIHYGDFEGKAFNSRITYGSINDPIKSSVQKNLEHFMEVFVGQSEKMDLDKKFNITLNKDFDEILKVMKENIENNLTLGIETRMRISSANERVNETLFFYPVIEALKEVGNFLYEGS